ncbi:hypothetical protein [Desulfuromonas sp. TF]|nr:hypothetical protein [Desulfuromonas sp. TF]
MDENRHAGCAGWRFFRTNMRDSILYQEKWAVFAAIMPQASGTE